MKKYILYKVIIFFYKSFFLTNIPCLCKILVNYHNEGKHYNYFKKHLQKGISMRRKRYKVKKSRVIINFIVLFAVIGVAAAFFLSKSSKVNESVIVEAGKTALDISQFVKDKKYEGTFVTDLSAIDMNKPGVHEIQIQIGKKVYTSKLEIKDTTAPTAEVVNQVVSVNEEKKADDFVKNISDVSDVKVSFKEQPDFAKAGTQDVFIVLEDISGNKTELKATLTVNTDTEAPKINGAKNQTVYIGDKVSYKNGVTVTDNQDKDVQLEVDSSAVNLKKAGSYNVIYKATDSSGNTTTETVVFTVIEKPKTSGAINLDTVNELADKVLATIINDSMSQKNKAKEIYKWTKTHISYVNTSDKSDWVKAAYQGFKKGSGDCFVYFSTAQALLNRAGIKNQGIIKIDGHHYWSLIDIGEGWRHFDTTPRKGDNVFYSLFYLTDTEIEKYSKAHKNSHVWDKSKYPAAE